ncbi:uncharacterized protein Dvar_47810 [Desulfosarcina variabilis str. Montpellier]
MKHRYMKLEAGIQSTSGEKGISSKTIKTQTNDKTIGELSWDFRVQEKNNYTRLRRICVRLQGASAGAYLESVPVDGTP